MLYDSDDLVGIRVGDYLRHLACGLMSTYARPELAVEVSVDAEDIRLDLSPMVCLGLMVNEMITNSFKYAFAGRAEGRIRVRMRRDDESGDHVFTYSDDGIGLPEDFDRGGRKSLGMVFIDSLARQLEYELRFAAATG